jgi:hypothetical protein
MSIYRLNYTLRFFVEWMVLTRIISISFSTHLMVHNFNLVGKYYHHSLLDIRYSTTWMIFLTRKEGKYQPLMIQATIILEVRNV